MAVNEQIVTGRKFRKLIDEANKIWQRISFWTKAIDVEFNDGNNAETKIGAINGVTDSLTSTASNVAASAKAVKTLNDKVTQLSSNLKRLQLLQSAYNMPQTGTINATSINGYNKLTADNFILDIKSTVYGGAGVSGIYALTKSYNQSTGILTISREYGVSAVVDVYVYA